VFVRDPVTSGATRIERGEIADEYVGHAIAHSPMDPEDGGWPHHVVRDVIEELQSEAVERGIQVERYNMRGVVGKAMFEGGRQERVLAEQYRVWAGKAAAKPRTAALLREIAESWDREAMSEDTRARQGEMRFE
jgi:alpha/beta superfamily hydrolase